LPKAEPMVGLLAGWLLDGSDDRVSSSCLELNAEPRCFPDRTLFLSILSSFSPIAAFCSVCCSGNNSG